MFCKNCGKEIADTSRFCRFCGTAVALPEPEPPVIPQPPVIPDFSEDVSAPSGTVPQIPDFADIPAAPPHVPEQDSPEPVGSYKDIMAEFSQVFYEPEEPAIPTPPPVIQDAPPKVAPSDAAKAVASRSASPERKQRNPLLIVVSGILLLFLLIGVVALCFTALKPDSPQEPVVEEQVESVLEVPVSPSPTTEPAPSAPELPQIAPPGTTQAPSVDSSLEAEAAPTEEVLPVQTHDAASGNTTVTGSRYVDNVALSAYFRSAPAPEESNVIGTVPVGTRIDFVEEYDGTYSKVLYEGTYGYIATQYLSEVKPNLTTKGNVYVANVDYCAYFRSTPKQTDGNVIDYVYLDQALSYIETTDNNYVKVKVGDAYGYVHVDYISFSQPNTHSTLTMYISGVNNGAYFLAYPRQGTNVIETLPPGTPVGYIENSVNGYCKVIFGGEIGYVLGDYLSETSPKAELNEDGRTALIEYSLNNGYTFYSYLDMNGDGLDEMLVCKEEQTFDGFYVSSTATLLCYEDGAVVEKGLLNEKGGDSPMFHVSLDDGREQAVTEYSETGLYVCTFYTLDMQNQLHYEAWSVETSEGVTRYYVDRDGVREETDVTAHNGAVLTPDYYYVMFEGHIG